jgi:hypothetical protein
VALEIGVRLVALALVALGAALLFGWSSLVPVSLLLLGSAYAVRLALDDPALDGRAPFLGAGLLVSGWLAYWSLDERERVPAEPGESLRHVGFVALVALASALLGAGLLALTDVLRTQGLAVDVLGAAAAASALLVVVLVARRRV